MDSLLFPQSTPAPLILPRRASIHGRKSYQSHLTDSNGNGNGNGRRGSPPGNSSDSSRRNNIHGSPTADNQRNPLTHYFYFPTTLYPPPQQKQQSPLQQHQQPVAGASDIGNGSAAAATGVVASGGAAVAPSTVTNTHPLDTTQEDYLSTINLQHKPPAIFAFGNERGTTTASTSTVTADELPGYFGTSPSLAVIRGQTHRRHSMGSFDRPFLRRSPSGGASNGNGNGSGNNNGNGSSASGSFSDLIQSIAESEEEEEENAAARSRTLWTTIPPRHALHMPIMKINPEIWRSESHNREIHRLMHEARERLIMKRRNIKAVMDTSEDGDEDGSGNNPDDGPGMADVVLTMDLGGWHALEEQEKEKVREQVMKEWKAHVDREYMAMLQRERQQQLLEEEQQQQERLRRNSWPAFVDPQQQQQQRQYMQNLQQYQQQLLQQQQQLQLQQQLQQQQHPLAVTPSVPSSTSTLIQHQEQPATPEQLQRLQQSQLQQRLMQQEYQLQQLMHQPKWNPSSSSQDLYGAVSRMPEHAPPPELQLSSTSAFTPPMQSFQMQPRTLQTQTNNLARQGAGIQYRSGGSWSAGTLNGPTSTGIHPSWMNNAPANAFDSRRASFTEYRK